MTQKNSCPLCQGTSCTPLHIGEPASRTGNNVLCDTCGLIYHNPMESPESMRAFYAAMYSGEYSASEEIGREHATARMAALKSATDITSIRTALEIGCAQGEFLHELTKQGIQTKGVEPSQQMSAHCRNRFGLDVQTGMYEDLPQQSSAYDLVCLFHVLEHVSDPLATLRRIRRELTKDGLLFLDVPTLGDCQLAIVFKTIHPTTFVTETLEYMVRKAGFIPVLIREQGYQLRLMAKPDLNFDDNAPFDLPYPDAAAIGQRVQKYVATRKNIVDNIIATLEPLKGVPRGAIYGAGLNTADLDQVFPLASLQLEAAFDKDPRKQGKSILGLPILAPQQLDTWQGNYLIISSYKYQQEIVNEFSHLQNKGIRLITLYPDQKQIP